MVKELREVNITELEEETGGESPRMLAVTSTLRRNDPSTFINEVSAIAELSGAKIQAIQLG